jgi:uncharacterized repeat protein (TIGR03803 family)
MRIRGGVLAVASTLLFCGPAAATTNLTTLTLYGGGLDGKSPYSRPVLGAGGTLYSTAYGGGENGFGTVFSLTPPDVPGGDWTKTVIYAFQGGQDGAHPLGNLMSRNGVLYGTTYQGGGSKSCDGGCGTVFRLTPPSVPGGAWTETVLYRFGANANFPAVGLVADKAGALYGVANAAYPNNHEVYKLVPPARGSSPWIKTSVFIWTQFEYPTSGLVIDAAGALYGTTYQGGTTRKGSVYSVVPPASTGAPWTMKVLYSFAGGSDGMRPYGLTRDGAGRLYGVTAWQGSVGGGTAYRLTPPTTSGGAWRKATLYNFSSASGSQPLGELAVKNGFVYGMTTGGGVGYGTVFKLRPPATGGAPWLNTTLWKFSGSSDGGNTYSGVSVGYTFGGMIVDSSGALYGTTSDSIDIYAPGTGFGSVFKITR